MRNDTLPYSGHNIVFKDLGIKDYKETWDYQESLHKEIVELKLKKQSGKAINGSAKDYVLFVEHPHVFTLGKSGNNTNLLIQENYLKSINATFYKINRGGDITYHGPGQIVGYPIIDLEHFGLNVRSYIKLLENTIIAILKTYDIHAGRLPDATGVWLDTDVAGRTRKICAIGVRLSRYVTMHGFALNVNTDLNYFRHINPCGFIDKGVTSMQHELKRPLDIEEVKLRIKNQLIDNLLKLKTTE